MPTTSTTDSTVMPHPTLTKIIGMPTQRTLSVLRSETVANARSVPSEGGDGLLGHARLALTAPEYAAVSFGNVAYITPPRPAVVVHNINAQADTMYRSDKEYKVKYAAWKLHHDTDAKLIQLLLAAVDDPYTEALKHDLWGYSNTTALAILTHLCDTYGQITADDLQANREKLLSNWMPPTNIEFLFANINDCIKFSTAGGDTISTYNAVNAGVATLKKTGLFTQDIREWKNRAPGDQGLAAFTVFFRKAEVERRTNTTAAAAGYHQANTVETEAMSTADSSLTVATLATQMALSLIHI